MANRISERVSELQRAASTKSESGFWEEFKYIQEEDPGTLTRKVGQKPENRPKNRYKNILPYDHSRVELTEHALPRKLSPASSADYYDSGSDYINANHVYDVDEPSSERRHYIAAQGCMQSTMGDFWRMIWQEGCHIVLMITLETERGKNKCIRYWPESSEASMDVDSISGRFSLTLLSDDDLGHYGLRTLQVTFKPKSRTAYPEPPQPRIVHQFYYKSWQDHSIPEQPLDVISLKETIDSHWKQFDPPGPALVHCSAGIGRTGTYIVIDILLEQICKYRLDCEIDVQRTVLQCRKQRSGLVQTESQYKFIYLVVESFVKAQQPKQQQQQQQKTASVSSESQQLPVQQLPSNNDYVNFPASQQSKPQIISG